MAKGAYIQGSQTSYQTVDLTVIPRTEGQILNVFFLLYELYMFLLHRTHGPTSDNYMNIYTLQHIVSY